MRCCAYRTLGAQEDGAVSYGRFRRFAILLPPERLTAMDPGVAWFEAATLIPPRELTSHFPGRRCAVLQIGRKHHT